MRRRLRVMRRRRHQSPPDRDLPQVSVIGGHGPDARSGDQVRLSQSASRISRPDSFQQLSPCSARPPAGCAGSPDFVGWIGRALGLDGEFKPVVRHLDPCQAAGFILRSPGVLDALGSHVSQFVWIGHVPPRLVFPPNTQEPANMSRKVGPYRARKLHQNLSPAHCGSREPRPSHRLTRLEQSSSDRAAVRRPENPDHCDQPTGSGVLNVRLGETAQAS